MNMKLLAMPALVAFGTFFLAAQLVTVQRIDPPVSSGSPPATPPQIEALLNRACYDCHSNQTRWPWYSRIAPISWLVARDVALGRKELNFSEWGSYYPQTRTRKLMWMGRALRERSMPPWAYRLMHPDARLTTAERAMLDAWVESAISTEGKGSRAGHDRDEPRD